MKYQEAVLQKGILSGVFLFGMTLVLSVCYGYQYHADPDNLLRYYLPFGATFYILIALILWLSSCASLKGVLDCALSRFIGLVLTVASSSLTLHFYSPELHLPTWMTVGALLCGMLPVAALGGSRLATTAAALFGTGVLIYLATTVPLDVAAANMLPIISAGCEVLLNLENPYLITFPDISSEPLGYLPGLVLPYCVPLAAGVDIRLLNVTILVTIIAYCAWIFDFFRSPERLSLGVLPLLLSPPAAQMMIHGHVWVYWLLVLGFAHAIWRQKLVGAAIVLGLMLATRQMSIFLAIPAAFYMSTQMRPRTLAKYGATAIGTYFLFMAPIVLTIPNWVERFYLGFEKVGVRVHLTYGNPMNQVSISGLLTELGFAGWLRPLQAVVLLATCAAFWIWRRRIDFPRALILMGVCYVLVIGLNSFLHRYFYMPGLILLALGIAYGMATPIAADGTRKSG